MTRTSGGAAAPASLASSGVSVLIAAGTGAMPGGSGVSGSTPASAAASASAAAALSAGAASSAASSAAASTSSTLRALSAHLSSSEASSAAGASGSPGTMHMNSRRRRHPEFTARRAVRTSAATPAPSSGGLAKDMAKDMAKELAREVIKDFGKDLGKDLSRSGAEAVAEHLVPPPHALAFAAGAEAGQAAHGDGAPELYELHFGVLLRRAREQQGLSVSDVAATTRISARFIPELEAARLDGLPAPVFVAGYVKSYARAVGLDERELCDRYRALVQHRAATALRLESDQKSQRRALARSARKRRFLVAALALLALGILAAVLAARFYRVSGPRLF